MRKIKFILLCAFLLITTNCFATLSITQTDCNELTVSTDAVACTNCYPVSINTQLSHMTYSWQLQKKSSNGTWFNVGNREGITSSYVKGNLASGTYRVKSWYPVLLNSDGCTAVYNVLLQEIGCIGRWVSDGVSEAVEIGFPDAEARLVDGNGQTVNGAICTGEPIYLDGSASFGEKAYYVGIKRLDANGNTTHWSGSGWITGKAGSNIDLTQIWKKSRRAWEFWRNNTFEVTFAVSQMPCDSWEAHVLTFETANCRKGKKAEITETSDLDIYPNPTSGYFILKNFEAISKAVNIKIVDLEGRVLKEMPMKSERVAINDLKEGVYLIQVFGKEEGEILHTDRIIVSQQ